MKIEMFYCECGKTVVHFEGRPVNAHRCNGPLKLAAEADVSVFRAINALYGIREVESEQVSAASSVPATPTHPIQGKCPTCGGSVNRCGHSKLCVYSQRLNDGSGMSQAICWECQRGSNSVTVGVPATPATDTRKSALDDLARAEMKEGIYDRIPEDWPDR